jgi:outer membrane lipoprotein SlyB
MKKLTLILASVTLLALVGCGSGSSSAASITTEVGTSAPTTTSNTVEGIKGLTQFPAVPAVPES